MNSWWDAPSCSSFLENICYEIWTGKMIMVFLPKHAPSGFLSELKIKLSKRDTITYEKIDLLECNDKIDRPIESLLLSMFELDKANPYVPKKASSIFSKISNDPNNVIVFCNVKPFLILNFKNFLVDLASYFNGIPVQKRQKILVMIDPAGCRFDDFIPEPGIVRFKFEGIINDLDQALVIRHYFNFNHNIQKRFPESIIISLSQFDHRLCEKLIECSDIHEKYSQHLEQFANENGWLDYKFKPEDQLSEAEIWERWSQGILDMLGNKPVYHSAFLRIHSKNDELEKRLWLSGIRILLPMIEEFRWRLIMSKKILFPFKYQDDRTGEVKSSKNDFEIGDMVFMIRKRQIELLRMSYFEKVKVIGYVELCREIRNELSHLKMPTAANIKKFFEDKESVELILEN